MEALYQYLSSRHWKAALWGAGIRGRAFAEVYGGKWDCLECAYDMDESKQGKMLPGGLLIRKFDVRKKDEIDCILVLNEAHLLSTAESLGEKKAVLFDMNLYLDTPYEIEDCVVK